MKTLSLSANMNGQRSDVRSYARAERKVSAVAPHPVQSYESAAAEGYMFAKGEKATMEIKSSSAFDEITLI